MHITGDDFVLYQDEVSTELWSDLLDCAQPGQDATEAVEYFIRAHNVTADNPRAYLEPTGLDVDDIDPDDYLAYAVWLLACSASEYQDDGQCDYAEPYGHISTY